MTRLEWVRFRGRVYRAHNPHWAHSPLSGEGAARHGGRYNRKGTPALYTSPRYDDRMDGGAAGIRVQTTTDDPRRLRCRLSTRGRPDPTKDPVDPSPIGERSRVCLGRSGRPWGDATDMASFGAAHWRRCARCHLTEPMPPARDKTPRMWSSGSRTGIVASRSSMTSGGSRVGADETQVHPLPPAGGSFPGP